MAREIFGVFVRWNWKEEALDGEWNGEKTRQAWTWTRKLRANEKKVEKEMLN